MRVRGLKPMSHHLLFNRKGVAPHAGAWIETGRDTKSGNSCTSRTPCGCVD